MSMHRLLIQRPSRVSTALAVVVAILPALVAAQSAPDWKAVDAP